jgi:hypothetical protein
MTFPLRNASGQTVCGFLAVLGLTASVEVAAKPPAKPPDIVVPPPVVVTTIEPWAAMPGATVEWTLTGKDVGAARMIWSTPDISMEPAPAQVAKSSHAVFKVSTPANAPLGVAAFRLATPRGVSNPTLFLIDNLPSIKASEDHRTPEKAQRVIPPIAVDGRCEVESIDYYRFHGQARRKFSAEVVAQRLGSSLDAVIKLVGPDGRSVAECDDVEGLGTDPRLEVTLPRDGDYTLEVRDARYTGGPGHRYRLRIGAPPLPSAPPPLSSALPVVTEEEPNDRVDQATKVAWPAVIRGDFAAPKDRDWFAFDVKKGDSLRFTAYTECFGSPAILYLRLTDSAGRALAEWNGANPKQEPLSFTFKEGGAARLMVEELARRGGPGFEYALQIEPAGRDFTLNASENSLNLGANLPARLKIEATRRGENGPIRLSVEGQSGWVLNPAVLEKGKTSVECALSAPPDAKPGPYAIKIVGRGDGADAAAAVASTTLAMGRQWPGIRFPPPFLNGKITAYVIASSPKIVPALATETPNPASGSAAGSGAKADEKKPGAK